MSNLTLKYGNLYSGIMGSTKAPSEVTVGMEATILSGRDRHPAKVAEIMYNKSGKVACYMLQRYKWTMDHESEGYATEIHWDEPIGEPCSHRIVTHGKRKGTVEDAYIGEANPFYDRSF